MDLKDRVLLAMYDEYQKGNADMRRTVRPERLQLEPSTFNRQIQALQTEGFIRGAVLVRDRDSIFPEQVILNRVALTNYGLHYLKSNLLQ